LQGDFFLIYDGSTNINKLSYTDKGLTVGLIYQYEVEVLNFNGPSPHSSPAVRAACDLPAGFNSVYMMSTSKTMMSIGWNYPLYDGGCVI